MERICNVRAVTHEEADHARVFGDLYERAFDSKDFDDTYLFDRVSAYFNSIVRSLIFPSDEEQDAILDAIEDVEDVLRLGIQVEKDSILFYTEMIVHSKYVEAKNAFRELLRQEKKHLRDLQKRLDEYRAQN